MYHTIGQRQGLGIGGLKDAGEEPWYVLVKDLEHNELIVGQGNDHPWLFSRALLASDIYWVNPIDLGEPRRLTAKVRYRQSDQPCTLEKPPRATVPPSMTRSGRSPPASPWCSMTAKSAWAAV
nr:hypothetical protein GCM10020185_65070 [Pseudomonas brassicacearum subsp. brassicacearum]